MPHSSGGGSHSGGSSGGSSFSSSGGSHSGGVESKPIYDHYTPGTHRYVYYRHGHPIYYYSEARASSGDVWAGITLLISLLIWLAFSIPFWTMAIKFPKKIDMDYDTRISIMDEADIITDEEESSLYKILVEFQEVTGVTPAVITTTNDAWQPYYVDLEQYAYDRYVNAFSDEKHWLVVYSTDFGSEFEDWYWQGMIGDDTGRAIGSRSENLLTQNIQKYLTDRTHYSVSQAIAQGFTDVSKVTMNLTINWFALMFLLVFDGAAVITMAPNIVTSFKRRGMDTAVRCPTDKELPLEDTCEYCGGVYVHGIHINCPHCGAPIKALAKQRQEEK